MQDIPLKSSPENRALFLRRLIVVFLFFILSGGWPLYPAQAQHLPVRIFTELDGLPSNGVFDITQDQDGEMWFATRGGVARYDGYQWTSYGRGDGLSRDTVRRITTDQNGIIWAATLTTPFSVSFFKNDQWHALPAFSREKWGWDLTDFKAHTRADGTTALAFSSATSVTLWDGEQWLSLEDMGNFSGITALEWVGEDLWVATKNGLRGIDLQTNTYIEEPVAGLPEGAVCGISLSPGGQEVDLLGSHWIGTVKHGRFELIAAELDLRLTKQASGVDLIRGPAGGWYFGDRENLAYFHRGMGHINLTQGNGMASLGASSLFRDRENNIWVCSLRGVTRISSRSISSFNQEQGLLADEVTSVLQLRSGAMVLGHGNGLTFFGDPNVPLPFTQTPGLSSRVIDLAEGPDGRIWIAADRQGLGYVDLQRNVHWVADKYFRHQGTFAVLFDQQERLWVGGTHGLFRKEGDQFVPIPLPDMDPMLSPFVRRLTLDTDGAILVATGMHGVYRLDGDRIDRFFMHGNNGNAQGAFCVYARLQGGYFVGTNAGLYRINNGKMEKSVAPDPLIDRPIYSITHDNNENIWFGSDVGALSWDGSRLSQYDINDGLLGNETNRDALFLDDNGDMWIGTDQGLSIYRPGFDLEAPGKPLVSLIEIKVDNDTFPADKNLELATSFRELVIQFRAVTMIQENNLQFRTWLEPFQETWQESRKIPSREVRYSSLSPGTYTFHLQAIRSDGALSDVIHSRTITVLPPIWQTWWFISGAVIILMGILWSVLSFLSNRRYTARLKLAVLEKTTELRASETAFKAESQRLSTTLQNISDGVVTVSPDGIIELANPAAQAIMGRPAEEILGAQLDSVFELAYLEDAENDPVEKQARDLPHLFTFSTPSGQQRDLEISTANIDGTGEHAGGKVMAFRDITDRRQMEKDQVRTQKLESLGGLAGGIAHDFNNLLTIMMGNLTLLEDSPGLSELNHHQLNRMKQAAIRSQALANQLLTFAKGGSPQLKKTHVADIIPTAVSFALSGSSVEYSITIDPDASCVKVDSGQFDQVISNLVINASQALDGKGKISIFVKDVPYRPEFESGGPHVMIEVRDEGCGIPAQNLDRIFDPYFTSKDKGNGLGLTTVYSIINKHHGYLTVESTVGVGTSFQIFLPACDKEPAETQEQDVKSIPDLKTDGGLKAVLVLDDEPDVREILSRMLGNLGLACVGVSDGRKAVAAYGKALSEGRPFSAVIVDLTIPGGMGGRETLVALLEMDPGVKAIVVSGYSTDTVMADYRNFGFSGAIRKPFDQKDLAEALKGIIV